MEKNQSILNFLFQKRYAFHLLFWVMYAVFMVLFTEDYVSFFKINCIEGNRVKVNNKSLPISRNYKDEIMNLIEQRLLKR